MEPWCDPDVDGTIILKWVQGRDLHSVLDGKPEERDHWGYPDLDGRLILTWMEGRDVHRILVGKAEGNRPLGKPR
jgi:hypothetical protein